MFCLVNILKLRDGRWGRAWEDNERALFSVTPMVGGKLLVLEIPHGVLNFFLTSLAV